MNPLYLTIFHTVMGQRGRCPACGKEQILDRVDRDQRYHCKHCNHRFTKEELQRSGSSR